MTSCIKTKTFVHVSLYNKNVRRKVQGYNYTFIFQYFRTVSYSTANKIECDICRHFILESCIGLGDLILPQPDPTQPVVWIGYGFLEIAGSHGSGYVNFFFFFFVAARVVFGLDCWF